MIHLDDGVLRAHLDRELPPGDAERVRLHVSDCAACRARLDRLRTAEAVVRDALGLLDGPVPESAWSRVSRSLAPGGGAASRRRGRPPFSRAAAVLVLLGGGVAAAVAPGSPLRTLWAPPALPPSAGRSGTVAERPVVQPTAGIRAPARVDAVEIALTAPAGTEVVVRTALDRAGVFGPPSTVFRTEEGVLRADFREGPARVDLPPALGSARIVVNGVLLAEVREGRVVTGPPDADPGSDEPGVLLRFRVP